MIFSIVYLTSIILLGIMGFVISIKMSTKKKVLWLTLGFGLMISLTILAEVLFDARFPQ